MVIGAVLSLPQVPSNKLTTNFHSFPQIQYFYILDLPSSYTPTIFHRKNLTPSPNLPTLSCYQIKSLKISWLWTSTHSLLLLWPLKQFPSPEYHFFLNNHHITLTNGSTAVFSAHVFMRSENCWIRMKSDAYEPSIKADNLEVLLYRTLTSDNRNQYSLYHFIIQMWLLIKWQQTFTSF
jgi:hypothetical protein